MWKKTLKLMRRAYCVLTGGHETYVVHDGPRHMYHQCVRCTHESEGIRWEFKPPRRRLEAKPNAQV
jgi:hypothetical protein